MYAMKSYRRREGIAARILIRGEWLVSCRGRLRPRKESLMIIQYESGWAPAPVLTFWIKRILLLMG